MSIDTEKHLIRQISLKGKNYQPIMFSREVSQKLNMLYMSSQSPQCMWKGWQYFPSALHQDNDAHFINLYSTALGRESIKGVDTGAEQVKIPFFS